MTREEQIRLRLLLQGRDVWAELARLDSLLRDQIALVRRYSDNPHLLVATDGIADAIEGGSG